MRMFFKLFLAAALVMPATAVSTTVEAKQNKVCTVEGSIYIEQLDRCILTVTNVHDMAQATDLETGRHLQTDMSDDPKCKPGVKGYDKKVVGPDGAPGIAHVVCGTRPN